VPSTLRDLDPLLGRTADDPIDQAMLTIDAARPPAGELAS
jgi:hypothetical protein